MEPINPDSFLETPSGRMVRLRLRADEHPEDPSYNERIQRMSPMQKLRAVFGWQLGDESWAEFAINCARECGFKIEES